MNNVSSPNEFKVVEFHNSTDFAFTPEMGCMFNSNPISGITGNPGVGPGESMKLPYYVGHQLAINLAKAVLTRKAPAIDPAGIPTGVPLWDTVGLEKLKNSFLTELYSESKPIAMSETDKLLAKVEEYKKSVDQLLSSKEKSVPVETVASNPNKVGYQDKAEVIAELTKRGIKFDARQSKANLEKLLV